MQLHITEKERLANTHSGGYEGMPSPRLADYLLNMDVQTNNNTKVKVEEIKREEEQEEDRFTRISSDIRKLFRPIDF